MLYFKSKTKYGIVMAPQDYGFKSEFNYNPGELELNSDPKPLPRVLASRLYQESRDNHLRGNG